MKKNPDSDCSRKGTADPVADETAALPTGGDALAAPALDFARQLIVFAADDCPACQHFEAEILDHWRSAGAVARTRSPQPPAGWTLEQPLCATPTVVLFERGKEVTRFTGYDGDRTRFWRWLGFYLLDSEQRRIAFEQGTERPGTGAHLGEKRPGTFVDPITGAPLFRSETKYDSGCGWPSFFAPVEGALSFHLDTSHGMRRIEVRSASSGIHLGHVFDDGPPPTGKRYCINGKVLNFVPDDEAR